MKQNLKPILLTSLALGGATTALQAAEAKEKMNVIIIMSDDHGYGDVEHTGNPYIKTPNLQRLQAESLVFDNFHTATTSSPTRSQLMTGRSCNAVGVWHTVQGRSILRPEDYTIANAFKDSGYSTAMFGKWHLGDNYPARPFDKGFDDVLWHKGGGAGQAPDYWNNCYFDDTYFRREKPEKQNGYCTDIWFKEAERFVTENQDKPFFCYLALNAAHAPFNVDDRYAEPYENENMNITSSRFYGMITNIDENIGKLLSLLKRLDLDDNTVVIFFGDNGTSGGLQQDANGNLLKGYDGGLRGKKGSQYEGGHRQAMVMHIPNRAPAKIDAITSCVDMMPTLVSLCELTPSQEIKSEGFDFLAKDYTGIDRTYVIDTQREEFLKKYKMSCVAKNDWRLINGTELYNLKADRRQQNNLADKYPEVVKQLEQEYEDWWKLASEREDILSPISVTAPGENEVVFQCMDMHIESNERSPYSQTLVRSAMLPPACGYWYINVEKPMRLDIGLYRWAPESGFAIEDTATKGRKLPSGSYYKPYDGLSDVASAKLVVDDKVIATIEKPDLSKPSVLFKGVKLPVGEHKFKALMCDSKGREFNAWYLSFVKK